MLERYRETQAWLSLSPATRKQREAIFRPIMERSGKESARSILRVDIEASIAARSATPFAAKNFRDAMRGLFRWGLKAKHVRIDPTEGVTLDRPRSNGFQVWTEEDVARFEKRWPLGTREFLALQVLLYTGLRRGDVCRLGRQHVRDGIVSIQTEKTGQWVEFPILPALAATIAASPTGDLTFIVGEGGRP